MTAFRDWPRTLQRASFRGVSFFVEQDQVNTGRRLVVHEFPRAEAPYIEDLGRDANKIQVRAYVVSDSADAEERALRSACERGGAGRLSLPMETFAAHCESCQREFSKDKLGYIAFSLTFIREGIGSIALPAGFLAARVLDLASAAVAAIGSLFIGGFRVNGEASFVAEAATEQFVAIAATIDAMARSTPLDATLAPGVLTGIQALHDDAGSLVAVGRIYGCLSERYAIADTCSCAGISLSTRVAGVLDAYRLAVMPEVAIEALEDLITYETAGLSVPAATPSRARIDKNRATLDATVRSLALAAWASAAASRIYTDRRQAIQARADAGERFAAELARVTPGTGHEAYKALVDLQAALVEYLSRRIADLAPVVVVEAGRTMPSLWWSNRLYGKHDRAGEIVARNRIIHASFMPATFEALAR